MLEEDVGRSSLLTSLSVSGASSVNFTECVLDASFSCHPSSSLLANSLISFACAALRISVRHPENKKKKKKKPQSRKELFHWSKDKNDKFSQNYANKLFDSHQLIKIIHCAFYCFCKDSSFDVVRNLKKVLKKQTIRVTN